MTIAEFEESYSEMSHRLAADDSPVWAVHDEAMRKHALGEDIYLLSVGDPDLPTQPSTIKAAIDSLEKGRTHYAPGRGELALRNTIADIEVRAAGKPCDSNQVVIFPGATNALYSVLACLVDPGFEVVVVEPMYVGYEGIFQALNLVRVSVPLDAKAGFTLDTSRISASITERTRVVLINTPGNPAGNVIPEEQLAEIAEICRSNNIWLVCDEVYSMITFDAPHVSLRRAALKQDNIVIVDGMSKSHAMTGWRVGWTVAPHSLADRLLTFTSSAVFGCCQFVQDAAAHALTNDEEYINGVREEYRQRRNYVCERIDQIQHLDCKVPAAGMFILMSIDESLGNGLEFAQNLLAQKGVSVMPGAGFGASTNRFVRVSLAQPINVLGPAFDRIEAYCRQYNGDG